MVRSYLRQLLAEFRLALQNSLQAVLLAMQRHHLSIKTLHINLHASNNTCLCTKTSLDASAAATAAGAGATFHFTAT